MLILNTEAYHFVPNVSEFQPVTSSKGTQMLLSAVCMCSASLEYRNCYCVSHYTLAVQIYLRM